MGLFDKIKNALFEEEYVEEEEKPKKESKPVETRAEKKAAKENRRRAEEESIKDIKPADLDMENTIPQPEEQPEGMRESNFKLYEDDDFTVEQPPKREVVQEVKEEVVVEPEPEVQPLYQGTTPETLYHTSSSTSRVETLYHEEKTSTVTEKKEPYSNKDYKPLYSYGEENKKVFKPTPIISPIYGILDKNYKKEDVVDRKEVKKSSSYVSTKVDIDSVRRKAFGGLNDDLNLTGDDTIKKEQEEKEAQKVEEELEDNLLYDMSDTTTTPVVNKVTVADAEEYFDDLGLEYNIDYKDSKYEHAAGRHVRASKEEPKKEEKKEEKVEEVKTEPIKPKQAPKKEAEDNLEDNLFDLIDSMYEDKE